MTFHDQSNQRVNHDCVKLGIRNCAICEARLLEDGEVAQVELQWPMRTHGEWLAQRADGKGRSSRIIEVGLNDVRAADSIRIVYDFDRDGYSIQQASTFSWPADDEVCDSDWQEVAFIQAWAREKANDRPHAAPPSTRQ